MNDDAGRIPDIPADDIEQLYQKLNREAEASGYHLNPDPEFTKELIRGLLINKIRFGYPACPCRLATGDKTGDLVIICPCDYRDPDLTDYSTCYCSLYVTDKVLKGFSVSGSIPERRIQGRPQAVGAQIDENSILNLKLPVWRCKVCGYLCGRENPPEVCPICKAQKERFERFI